MLNACLLGFVARTQPCTPAPWDLVSWWPAEGNAADFIGTNNGVLVGGLSFTNGEVGEGLSPYPPSLPTFIVGNASSVYAGNYSVVITALNTHVSVTSSVVSLTVVSPPVINGVMQNADGSFTLDLVTMTNMSSRVYAATDLCPPVWWLPVYTNLDGGAWQFTDTNTGGVAWKYYRVSTP
jgi:hypothetical protein